jgi:ribosome biogenesis protein Nip4
MKEIDDFTSKFTKEKIDSIMLKRNFYQVTDELLKFKESIKSEPFAIGTYLGSGKPFHPSTALLDWLNERTDRFVVLDKKASWLFLCGRDIFSDSILKRNVDEGLTLIKNEQGEVLGYGEFTGRKVAIRNLLDKGDFLRRERH